MLSVSVAFQDAGIRGALQNAEGKIAVFNSCETSAYSAGSSTKLSYSKFLAGCRDAELPPCPLLAQSGHCATEFQCPLSGVKRTFS